MKPDAIEEYRNRLFIPKRPIDDSILNKSDFSNIELECNGKKFIFVQMAVIPYNMWRYCILETDDLSFKEIMTWSDWRFKKLFIHVNLGEKNRLIFRIVDRKYLIHEEDEETVFNIYKKYFILHKKRNDNSRKEIKAYNDALKIIDNHLKLRIENKKHEYNKHYSITGSKDRVLNVNFIGCHNGWEIDGIRNELDDKETDDVSYFWAYNLNTSEWVKGNFRTSVRASSKKAFDEFLFLFPFEDKEDWSFYYKQEERNRWAVENKVDLFNNFISDDVFAFGNDGNVIMERHDKTYELEQVFVCKYKENVYCILRPIAFERMLVVYKILKDATTQMYQLCYPTDEENEIIKLAYYNDDDCRKYNVEVIKEIIKI